MTRPEAPRVDGPDDWHRQSGALVALRAIRQLPTLAMIIVMLVISSLAGRGAGGSGGSTPLASMTLWLVVAVAVCAAAVVPWLTTKYQVTDEHVRLRTGLLNKKVATARRDRIRSVDLTAPLLHRAFGLTKVVIGTGTDEGNVELECVAAPYGQALHDYLMPTGAGPASPIGWHPVPGTPTGPVGHDAPVGGEPVVQVDAPPHVLARFHPDWLRFAPFVLGGFAAAAALVGFIAQIAGQAGVFDRVVDGGTVVLSWFSDVPLMLVIIVAALIVVVLGAVFSVGGYVLSYWDFTLSRHPDATLRVSRGLLTTIRMSLDESRVRGVQLHEPVLMWPLAGAKLFAIATGASKRPLLVPPAPRDEVRAVAGAVVGMTSGVADRLPGHGPAAQQRRLTRALWSLPFAAIPLVAAALGWLPLSIAIALTVVVAVAAVLAGPVRARHLGSAVTDRLVIISPPRIARHRYFLERDGIIGWAVSSSPFQRRQGVATLRLATAAGVESYPMVDLTDEAVVGVMAEATPDLVRPFLVSRG